MLLTEPFFKSFTKKDIIDATKGRGDPGTRSRQQGAG